MCGANETIKPYSKAFNSEFHAGCLARFNLLRTYSDIRRCSIFSFEVF